MKKLSFLTPAAIVFFCATASIAFNVGYVPQENLQETCELRINILEKDLQKALFTQSYARKYKSQVRAKREAVGLKKESIKGEMQELRRNFNDKYGMSTINCLLKTTELLIKLDKITHAGNKSLHDFSDRWQKAFSARPK